MDASDIVKRLIELKKVSVQLKETSENPVDGHSDLLRGILQFGKKLSNHSSQLESPRFAQKLETQNRNSVDKKIPAIPNLLGLISQNNPKHNHSEFNKFSVAHEKISPNISEGQLSTLNFIEKIKQENQQLEGKLAKLSQELEKLKEIQIKQKQEEWKDGLPYFTLNHPRLNGFCTKLKIAQDDYSKIDFVKYSVSLSLEHIILTPTRTKNGSEQNHQSVDSPHKKAIILNLKNLKEVEYPPQSDHSHNPHAFSHNFTKTLKNSLGYMIIYYFLVEEQHSFAKRYLETSNPSSVLQTLFLHFETQEERDQWDMGIYVNFKILQNLRDRQLDQNKELLVENEDEDKNNKTSRFQELKQQLKLNRKSSNSQSDEISPFFMKFTSDKVEAKEEGNEENENQKQQQSENSDSKDEQEEKQRLQEEAKIKAENDRIEEEKRKQEERKKEEQQRLKKEQFQEELRREKMRKQQQRKQEEINAKIVFMKMQKDLETKKAKQYLQKTGIILTRYAKKGFNAHIKRVHLDPECKKLCWRDPDKSDYKSVLLSEIVSINQGELGEGIKEHENIKKIMEKGINRRFCLIRLTNAERETLEFGAKQQTTMEKFCKCLELCVNQAQSPKITF